MRSLAIGVRSKKRLQGYCGWNTNKNQIGGVEEYEEAMKTNTCAGVCLTSLLVTLPGMTVLADEISIGLRGQL